MLIRKKCVEYFTVRVSQAIYYGIPKNQRKHRKFVANEKTKAGDSREKSCTRMSMNTSYEHETMRQIDIHATRQRHATCRRAWEYRCFTLYVTSNAFFIILQQTLHCSFKDILIKFFYTFKVENSKQFKKQLSDLKFKLKNNVYYV